MVLGRRRHTMRLHTALVSVSALCAVCAHADDTEHRNLLARRLKTDRNKQEIKSARTASCVFDVLHAMTYLSQAGVSIDAATRKCHNPTRDAGANSALCSVSMTQMLESFAYAASFLSAIAIDCTNEANVDAACASSVTALVGAMGDLAQAGSGMSYDCPGASNHPGRRLDEEAMLNASKVENSVAETHVTDALEDRRLWSPIQNPVWTRVPAGQQPIAVRNYNTENAYCGIYAAQATFFLARAGLNINEAAHNCPGLTDADSVTDRALCGVDVTGALLSVINVGSFVAGAVAQCQHGLNAPAACSADIMKLVAAMTVVANAAQGIFISCVNHVSIPETPLRRLVQNKTVAEGNVLV
eukprot:TRINITY_DN27517_c0_g1_i1.p1 TRINITY_DN27517_c0_g1~~TRINITY_DN27517_c0_g1_i1.p1  ORF type:complete len:357 (+),score=44.75 TRINITY_DN27517_c0_g1_i1:85-1155(+)